MSFRYKINKQANIKEKREEDEKFTEKRSLGKCIEKKCRNIKKTSKSKRRKPKTFRKAADLKIWGRKKFILKCYFSGQNCNNQSNLKNEKKNEKFMVVVGFKGGGDGMPISEWGYTRNRLNKSKKLEKENFTVNFIRQKLFISMWGLFFWMISHAWKMWKITA